MVSRIERLFSLLNVLMAAERPISGEQLRARVPGYPEGVASFQRQFERDKLALRHMGLPLEVEEVPGSYPPVVGYRIKPEAAQLRDPGLEPDELAALHLAASVVRLEGIEGSAGLWKLGAGPAPDGSEGVVDLPADERLVALFAAAAERRVASFRYRDVDRTVHPWRLDCTRGRWYVTGHDAERGAARHFRLDRIQSNVLVGPPGGFDRPEGAVQGVRMEAWQFGEGRVHTAHLVVDAGYADELRQSAPTARSIEERADGAVVFEIAVTDVDAFRSLVLGLLEHAEILSPDELRHDIVHWLSGVVERGTTP